MDASWEWFEDPEPDADLVGVVSELPLSRYRALPKFFRMTNQVRSQLASSEGLVGYALRTALPRRTFWTISIWKSEAALQSFVRENPHGAIMSALQEDMEETRFDRFVISGDEVPLTIDEAFDRARD